MRGTHHLISAVGVPALCAATLAASAGEVPASTRDPKSPLAAAMCEPQPGFERWTLDYDVGSLWRVSDKTFLDYVVVPQTISLRSPEHNRATLENGATLIFRSRFSLLGEWIARGPEDFYFGISGSPSFEYWLPGNRTEFHFSIGGGIGWTDSQGVPGGQGQDMTWNWFMLGGVRHRFSSGLSLHAGVLFQHMSNRGATDPNPGLDALGPVVGLSWSF